MECNRESCLDNEKGLYETRRTKTWKYLGDVKKYE